MSETSIDIYRVPTIFIMLNESPARLFMALRNVLDCSCDETVFTVKMTLLQRTRPFHGRLLTLMQSVAEIHWLYYTHNITKKRFGNAKIKFFQHRALQTEEKNVSLAFQTNWDDF